MLHSPADAHGILDPVSVIEAIERNVAHWYGTLATMLPGASVVVEEDHLRVASAVAHPACNAVIAARLERTSALGRIRSILGEYDRRKVPALWWVGPSSKPVDQQALLTSAGLELTETLYGMAADLASLPDPDRVPPDWSVERVTRPSDLQAWMLPFADTFHLRGRTLRDLAPIGQALISGERSAPTVRLYVGRQAGRPVSCASLLTGPGVAGVYYVGTRPPYRGRGCATALVSTVMRDAREAGYRLCVLHATPLSVDLYRRLGYMEYCRLRTLLWRPSGR